MRPWSIKMEIVGPHVVLPKLRGPKLMSKFKVHEVVMEFLGLVWALR